MKWELLARHFLIQNWYLMMITYIISVLFVERYCLLLTDYDWCSLSSTCGFRCLQPFSLGRSQWLLSPILADLPTTAAMASSFGDDVKAIAMSSLVHGFLLWSRLFIGQLIPACSCEVAEGAWTTQECACEKTNPEAVLRQAYCSKWLEPPLFLHLHGEWWAKLNGRNVGVQYSGWWANHSCMLCKS